MEAATRTVLDSSAVLSMIEEAAGAERVETALRQSSTIVPWPVLVEVWYVSAQRAGEDVANHRYAFLCQSSAEKHWRIDEQLALTAARIKAAHRLSFADALIAAYALRQEATLLHGDPDFETIEGLRTEMLPFSGA